MRGLVELDRAQLEQKIRLLSFASLGFTHIGHDLPYSEVASTLQIELNQVEKWAIDGIVLWHPVRQRCLNIF